VRAEGPFLVLRDFRVYFPKRRGLLDALRGTDPGHVRAVDGLDLEIRKGEVYCLVGESGCGKTTTGKGILRLVEPYGGDVLLKMPPDLLASYDEAKARGDEERLDGLRRRWSLSYRDERPWTRRDRVTFLLAAACGTILFIGLGAALAFAIAAVTTPFLSALAFLLSGVVLGFVATRPPVAVSARLPQYVSPFALIGTVFAAVTTTAFEGLMMGASLDVAGAVQALLAKGDLFILGVIPFQLLLGYAGTWLATGAFVRRRELETGFEGNRIARLRRHLQIIFQDPYEYLNPKHSVYDIVSEPLVVNKLATTRAETEARVRKALDDAGLRPPEDFLYRYPHELSGGQRQRVSIAGALVLEPDFLVADEPVSMLDVSIRTEILELLLELRTTRGLTYLFITHDLSLAWVLADRIGVMYLGKIVEEGPTREVIKDPKHPYTKALISVVPAPNPNRRHERIILKGERPDPANIPRGCRFHPRCPVAFDKCGWTASELLEGLQELAPPESPIARGLAEGAPENRGALLIPGQSDETRVWLKDLKATRSEEYRVLKAMRATQETATGLRVLMHDSMRPSLSEVAPGVRVACHLFT